jgi:hypothetical protein
MRGIGLIVILVPALFGSLPAWPYSNDWGFFPSAALGLVLVITLALALAGQREPPT